MSAVVEVKEILRASLINIPSAPLTFAPILAACVLVHINE